jgi:hypothetical protein
MDHDANEHAEDTRQRVKYGTMRRKVRPSTAGRYTAAVAARARDEHSPHSAPCTHTQERASTSMPLTPIV